MKHGFVDTNVLLYAATGADDEPAKWERALDLLRGNAHCVSGQVLAEFYQVATKKLGLPVREANEWLFYLDGLDCQPVDREVVLDGAAISQRYHISYWDAALIAAAKRLRVDTIYSEDLNHGQSYDGVMLFNPFLEQ